MRCLLLSVLLLACTTPAVAADDPVAPADRPLYTMDETDIDAFLPRAQKQWPDLRERIAGIARLNLGQPYDIYLLGEAPFETIDPQPIYCLDRSDCVVFAEHTLAMALTDDWPSFLTMLQRIRYADGHIGVRTRNHYTEGDWNPNNTWLLKDVSRELAGEKAATYTVKIDRARFFKTRYELDENIPVEELVVDYVPVDATLEAAQGLRSGDVINFVRGKVADDGQLTGLYVGHVGLVVREGNGEIRIIHSANPQVREQPLAEIVEGATAQDRTPGRTVAAGFIFLRLQEDALERLATIDGEAAPKVPLPDGSRFDPSDVPLENRDPTTAPVAAQ